MSFQIITIFFILVAIAVISNLLLMAYFHTLILKEDVLHKKSDAIDEQSNVVGKDEIILKILSNSGVEVNSKMIKKLPTMEDFTSMYGPKQKIIGLGTCENFQSSVSPLEAIAGPTGAYNTGTHLLSTLLMKHCVIKERAAVYDQSHSKSNRDNIQQDEPVGVRTGIFDNVPWGKHGTILFRREGDYRPGNLAVNQALPNAKIKDVLPIVMIKDPFSWMGSMCRNPYGAIWYHSFRNCFNFNKKFHRRNRSPRLTIAYEPLMKGKNPRTISYNNLVDMWNSFYGEYLNADFPRLIIRYEDLLLHADEVIPQICECVGGEVTNDENGIHINGNSAKDVRLFGKTSNLADSIIRYGSNHLRTEKYSKEDMVYANEKLSKDLMKTFHYEYPQI